MESQDWKGRRKETPSLTQKLSSNVSCLRRKKEHFFHWNFTEHTNLTYAHNGQNNVNSVLFLETFFLSLFELFFFPYCFFAYVLWFLILCFYRLVCVHVCVCICICLPICFLSFIPSLSIFFSFLKSEKGRYGVEWVRRQWGYGKRRERRSFD